MSFRPRRPPSWVDSYAIGRAVSFGAYDEADRGASSDALVLGVSCLLSGPCLFGFVIDGAWHCLTRASNPSESASMLIYLSLRVRLPFAQVLICRSDACWFLFQTAIL